MRALVIFLLFATVPRNHGKTVKLTKLETCKEHPESKAKMTSVKITSKDGTQFISHKINVTVETESWNKLIIYAVKCPNRDNLNFCENYRNFTIPQIGNLAGLESTSWGKKMEYTPPLKFPLKKGLYSAEQVKLDTVWSVIAAKGYWRNHAIILTDEGEIALCVYAEGEIF